MILQTQHIVYKRCLHSANQKDIKARQRKSITSIRYYLVVKTPTDLALMVAYFCHHLSDNYVDLSDNYVDLSDLYIDLSDHYVDLSENYVDLSDNDVDLSDIKLTSRWQLVELSGNEYKILSYSS